MKEYISNYCRILNMISGKAQLPGKTKELDAYPSRTQS